MKRDSELPWLQGSWPPKECCWGDTAWTSKGRRGCMWGKRGWKELLSWSQTGFWAGVEQVPSHPSSPSGRLELPWLLSADPSSQRPASFHQPVYSYESNKEPPFGSFLIVGSADLGVCRYPYRTFLWRHVMMAYHVVSSSNKRQSCAQKHLELTMVAAWMLGSCHIFQEYQNIAFRLGYFLAALLLITLSWSSTFILQHIKIRNNWVGVHSQQTEESEPA